MPTDRLPGRRPIGLLSALSVGATVLTISASRPIVSASAVTALLSAQATRTPNILFRDDFSTRADRWTLMAENNAAATIAYSAPVASPDDKSAESALIFRVNGPVGPLVSTPDTELLPDTFSLDMQATWTGISSAVIDKHARVGAVLAQYGDGDFIAVTVSHDGLVQVSHYQNTWQDLVPPQHTPISDLSALNFHIVLSAPDVTSTDRQIDVSLNNMPVLTGILSNYTAGTFGIMADNSTDATSSTMIFSVHHFQISESPSP